MCVCAFLLSLAEDNGNVLDETPQNILSQMGKDNGHPKCLLTIQLTSLGSDRTDTLLVPAECTCVHVCVLGWSAN